METNLKTLKEMKKGLKKAIKKSRKFSDNHRLNMERFNECAFGTFFFETNNVSWSHVTRCVFGFEMFLTAQKLIYTKQLSEVQKRLNYLFIAPNGGSSYITVIRWREAAKSVLIEIKEEIKKVKSKK